MNLVEYKSIGTQWKVLYVNDNNGNASYDATYFDSFGVEHIPKEIKKFIGTKNDISNIYALPAYDSITCGYSCIGFNDFMLKIQNLLDFIYWFSPNEYKKNDKIILKYFR